MNTSSIEKAVAPYRPFFGRGIEYTSSGDVRLKHEGVTLFGPPEFLYIAKEVMIEGDYDFDVSGQDFIMIDIGLNVGITSLWTARKPCIRKVYGFEPFGPTFRSALLNLKANPQLSAKIEAFNFGLSNADKAVEVRYLPSSPGVMSTVWDKFHDHEELAVEQVELREAAAVLRPILKSHTERVFMKMDCEGAELEIIPHLHETGILKQVDFLVLEWHRQDPQPLVDLLTQNGFLCLRTKESRGPGGRVGVVKAVRIS